ncbi:MAG TPA: rhomboid family intramembrane serine protease [Candidatus Polarisedimenticolia bacterium]|jgi:membrane associated rhomboid family serine protease|nr:rhomboid family intramembrane serine protease [Candidatus Polarisedimenticolia bacterium]
MFIPLGDDNRDRRIAPLVNIALIAANVLVFVFLQGFGSNVRFTYSLSMVPAEILTGRDVVTDNREVTDPTTGEQFEVPGLQPTPWSVYLTLITSMFMHGGLAHLLGNMLFLWIFGDNIENSLGHVRYLVFYLVTGVLASCGHLATVVALGQDLNVPSLGASGAISGVLGGYLLLFPRRAVRVLIVRTITTVPAIVAIGMWFLFQVVSGIGLLGGSETGVAYGAHIGGFVAGLVLVKVFMLGIEQHIDSMR